MSKVLLRCQTVKVFETFLMACDLFMIDVAVPVIEFLNILLMHLKDDANFMCSLSFAPFTLLIIENLLILYLD